MTTKFGEHCGTWNSFWLGKTKRIDLGITLTDSQTFPGGSFRQSFFSGSENPRWKSIIRSGGNAGTPAGGTRYSQSLGYVYDQVTWKTFPPNGITEGGKDENWGVPSTMDPSYLKSPSVADIISVENRAISKFLSACDSARSSVEVGQDLGELKETLNGLINPLGSLRKHVLGYFDKLKKVRRSTKRDHLPKVLADTYLEWTFGWKPLASDIADAYSGLKHRKDIYPTYPVAASAETFYDGSVDPYTLWHSPFSIYTHFGNVQSTARYQTRYKGVVRTGSVNGSIGIAQVLQLDLPHFVPTIWDLLPYSFIADYFANIGDIINAYSFVSSNLAWVVKTTRNQCVREYAPDFRLHLNVDPEQTIVLNQNCGAARSKFSFTQFTRTIPEPSSLVPTFQFKLPHSHKPWENLGAIMVSRSKSLVPFTK